MQFGLVFGLKLDVDQKISIFYKEVLHNTTREHSTHNA